MYWDKLTREEQERLHAEEIEIELHSLDVGIARFREQCAKGEMSELPAARRLMVTALAKVQEEIKSKVSDWLEKGRAIKGADYWGIPFMSIESDKLAVIALSVMLDLADKKNRSLAAVTACIGDKVETEYHFMLLREEAPKLKKMMERRFKNWTPSKVRYALKKAEDLYQYWPAKRRRWVGAMLMEIVLAHTEWFDCVKIAGKNGHHVQTIRLRENIRKMVTQQTEALEVLNPSLYPMVVPPNDWTGYVGGGYRYHKLPFVKRQNNWDRPLEQDVVPAHHPLVYDAVNMIQRTPWKINDKVLRVIEQCWSVSTGQWPGIPPREQLQLLKDISPPPDDPEKRKEWRKKGAAIYERNIQITSERLSFLSHLMVGQKMVDYSAIFFPHQMDFRGRVYPVPQPLHPQGCDLARGLLLFADGKPLGKDGMKWLMIHAANSWGLDGIDKRPMQERIEWTRDNLDAIKQAASNPLDHSWWADAENPWQFLAACFEIADAMMYPNHKSCLPIQVDGSNSGLQHFSAMLKDVVGATLTNLAPSQEPNDIYGLMAKWVTAIVEKDCAELDAIEYPITNLKLCKRCKPKKMCRAHQLEPCKWWLGKVNRKTCKRGTMTYVYGVTQQGIENYLMSDKFVEDMPEPFRAARYLRNIIWQGLQENVVAAATVMDWLRNVASIANKKNVALRWVTPSGFVAVQEYIECEEVIIRTLDRSIRYAIPGAEPTVSHYKQRNSLPPNFVHSMDASHLMLTVTSGAACGITHWSMIHDSFGSHACDMEELNIILREEFIRMYEVDVLARFKEQIESQIGEQLPEPPQRGAFDITQVRESEFIFA